MSKATKVKAKGSFFPFSTFFKFGTGGFLAGACFAGVFFAGAFFTSRFGPAGRGDFFPVANFPTRFKDLIIYVVKNAHTPPHFHLQIRKYRPFDLLNDSR